MNYKDTNKRAQCKIYFDIAEREYLRPPLTHTTIQNKNGAQGVLFFEKFPGSFEVLVFRPWRESKLPRGVGSRPV